jgi:beta-ribofuranosylaminobenzene 5'-phosphate synthase
MRVLPALATRDLSAFGGGIAEIQRRVGDHFAPFQGGGRFTSPAVAEALALLEEDGVAGPGQSSWGPTGFAFLPSDEAARRAVERLDARASGLHFRVTCGRNRGADITDLFLAT